MLNSKIIDQYQTKIEAASKYRIRLSGIVLLNVFGNHGSVDNQDFPTWAIGPGANLPAKSLGASLRQSEVGLEVFGPRLAGAKTTGNVQVDFSGGFTNTSDGVNLGLVRLHGHPRMDWKNTSIVAGQDDAFMFRSRATSFARWLCRLSVMPATFGDGSRMCESSTTSISRKDKTLRCKRG